MLDWGHKFNDSDFTFYGSAYEESKSSGLQSGATINDFIEAVNIMQERVFYGTSKNITDYINPNSPIPDTVLRSMAYGKWRSELDQFIMGAGSGLYSTNDAMAVTNGRYNTEELVDRTNSIGKLFNLMRKANRMYSEPTANKSSNNSTSRVAYGLFGKEPLI